MLEDIYKKLHEWERTKDISLATDICEDLLKERTAENVVEDVMVWGRNKRLNDPKAQLNKVIEEVGEIAHEITRNKYGSDELVDAIGDTLVTVIILSDILGRNPIKCLDSAYQVIKDRSGETKNGTFVREA